MASNYTSPPGSGTATNITLSSFADAAVQLSSEAFSDADSLLMTAASIDDRIASFSYLTAATASSTYATIANPTFTGTIALPNHANVETALTSIARPLPQQQASERIPGAPI